MRIRVYTALAALILALVAVTGALVVSAAGRSTPTSWGPSLPPPPTTRLVSPCPTSGLCYNGAPVKR